MFEKRTTGFSKEDLAKPLPQLKALNQLTAHIEEEIARYRGIAAREPRRKEEMEGYIRSNIETLETHRQMRQKLADVLSITYDEARAV